MTHENNGRSSGIVQALREMLEAIAAAEEERQRHGEGSTTVGRTRIGYEFSIGAGHITETEPHPHTHDASPELSDRAIAVRYTDENVLVTIDAPEIDPATVSAGTDDSTGELLIASDGTIEERIPLRQQGLEIVDASFTNGILELRLRPMEGIEE